MDPLSSHSKIFANVFGFRRISKIIVLRMQHAEYFSNSNIWKIVYVNDAVCSLLHICVCCKSQQLKWIFQHSKISIWRQKKNEQLLSTWHSILKLQNYTLTCLIIKFISFLSFNYLLILQRLVHVINIRWKCSGC